MGGVPLGLDLSDTTWAGLPEELKWSLLETAIVSSYSTPPLAKSCVSNVITLVMELYNLDVVLECKR